MNERAYVADARVLLDIQAKCRKWGEALRRNGWDTDRMAAANTPEAKAAELAVMALIKKDEGLLTYCRSNFVSGPSTPLDRAFDYIGIYLDRGPEALEHTVGLAECLTVEVAHPDVAEPYREPTFIVQLGRWAERLSDESARAEGPAAPQSSKACEADSGGAATPSLDDVRFLQELARDIRDNPGQYREAGEWLDRRFNFEACRGRLATKLRLRQHDWQAHWWNSLKRRCERRKKRTTVLGKRGRFLDALHYYQDSPGRIIGQKDARRICLLTSLLLDPDADNTESPLTEFQKDWPWGDDDDFCFREHVQTKQFGRLYTTRECVWMVLDEPDRRKWIALARRAWARMESTSEFGFKVKRGDVGRGDSAAGDRREAAVPVAGGEAKPGGASTACPPVDGIRLAVAVSRYSISRNTLYRAIREGTIKGYRPPEASRNSPYIVSEAEVARHWPLKQA